MIANASVLKNNDSTTAELTKDLLKSPYHFIHTQIAEAYPFYGLASYYNSVNYYWINKSDIIALNSNKIVNFDKKYNKYQWFVAVGRFKVLIIQAVDVSIKLHNNNPVFYSTSGKPLELKSIKIILKSELSQFNSYLEAIHYGHLWAPLAKLSVFVEKTLKFIHFYISNWILVIIVFSVLLKLLLLPVSIKIAHFQHDVNKYQAILANKKEIIKTKYKDAAEIHNYLMEAYKELKLTPFYTLKPMLGAVIQVPILIAVFNVLGEMPELESQPFLWGGGNLAYPDKIFHLPFTINFFGNIVSLLPFVMTGVTIFSTIIFKNNSLPEERANNNKRNLYLMALVFFIFFYPFPSAMVFFWCLANILQAIQQQLIKI